MYDYLSHYFYHNTASFAATGVRTQIAFFARAANRWQYYYDNRNRHLPLRRILHCCRIRIHLRRKYRRRYRNHYRWRHYVFLAIYRICDYCRLVGCYRIYSRLHFRLETRVDLANSILNQDKSFIYLIYILTLRQNQSRFRLKAYKSPFRFEIDTYREIHLG